MRRFDGKEDFVIQCKDNCGFRHADICKRCEDRIKKAIQEAVGLGYPATDKTNKPDKTELYFDDREICKFSCNGECTNIDVHRLINCDLYCDGYSNETCRYRDMEKKTLSEAIVKESEEE
jgi:hypothetical protein